MMVRRITMDKLKGTSVFDFTDEAYAKISKEHSEIYNYCCVCKKRVVLTVSKYPPKGTPHYCEEHCPQHKWQADFDYPTHCQICGVDYDMYLESVLDKHNISYDRR